MENAGEPTVNTENWTFRDLIGNSGTLTSKTHPNTYRLRFNKILEKAKELEKKMRESQDNLKKIEVNGISGGDAVTVLLNGEGEMTKIILSDKVLNEDKEIIQDLIIAAHNDAKNKLKSKTSEEISKATGGLGVPGFKWPL